MKWIYYLIVIKKKHIMKNILKLSLLFIVIAISTLASCDKDCDRPDVSIYEFVLPFELSPAKEVYNIGDTITISANIPNSIYERKTNQNFILENTKFYLTAYIYDMDTNIIDYSDINRFIIIFEELVDGQIFTYSDGHSSILSQFKYANNTYKYSIKIVCKSKGLFVLFQGTNIYTFGEDRLMFAKQCDNTKIDAKVYMNNRGDNNLNLANSAKNEHYKKWVERKEKYLDYGGYCFRVVD